MFDKKEQFRLFLIEWHEDHNRKYPWRETGDPFNIIIAEILLKLTGAWKAEKVYNYLTNHYGSPERMAAASPEELRPLFHPLGLFRRGETLIKIAQEIQGRFKGEVPRSYEELVSIKGIGEYIANAVLCFAYNKRVPLVDGSVSRVFKRCFGFQSDKEAYADRILWEMAWELLPEDNYKQYNLALLDFGALVCKNRKPLHNQCPIKSICYAYKTSIVYEA